MTPDQYDVALERLEHAITAALEPLLSGWLDPGQRAEASQQQAQQEQTQHRVELAAAAVLVPVLASAAATAGAALLARLGVKAASELSADTIASGVARFVGTSAAFQVARHRRAIAALSDRTARKAAQDAALEGMRHWAAGVAVQAATVTMSQAREAAVSAAVMVNESGAPVMLARTWTTQHDEKVRAAHAEADGQRQPFGTSFLIGGYPMRYPGDTLAPASLTANCRCRLRYTITKG